MSTSFQNKTACLQDKLPFLCEPPLESMLNLGRILRLKQPFVNNSHILLTLFYLSLPSPTGFRVTVDPKGERSP